MYLKSVEVQGFKSFANKMVLSFGSGITAIVGPNGSGKSNVADAVRWVLGEQSAKQLRGFKMEDVIFAGTKVRKAQSFAYVAITLDNSDHLLPIDYEEVTVSRRVYRSGESEYLINGNQCRLKDVQELFLDTGIGKEGYSIIGQGQIEKILSGRPEDRRELFDEAAGITKFKKRKATAIKHLSEERANLERVQDILKELSRQVIPLEEQSEKAKLFLSYRDELKQYEIIHFMSEYDKSEEIRIKAVEDEQIAKESLEYISSDFLATKEEYERMESDLQKKNQELDEIRAVLSDEKLHREKLEGTINVIEEKIKAAKLNHQNFEERIGKEEAKIEALRKLRQEEKEKEKELKKQQTKLEESLFSLQNSLEEDLASKKKLFERKEKKVEEGLRFEKEKAEASGLIKLYTTNIEQNKIKRLEITQKILRNKETIHLIQNKLKDTEEKVASIDADIQEIRSTEESTVSLISALKDRRMEMDKKYKNKQKDVFSAKAVLSTLKNMSERYDGYGNSVKFVMELKKEDAGIIGVVADIVKVKKDYELAIETAMGASIQNIVVEKEEIAKKAIYHLKSQKLGRATFLPLDAIGLHNPGNFGGALYEKGILGVASSLVEFEPRFANIISHILGRTLVAENMDIATKIARKYKYSLRIVTTEGEQLNPGGSISGGSYRNSNNLLGRAREIEEKEKELDALNNELKSVFEEGAQIANAIVENKKSLELYKSRLSELRIEYSTEMNAIKQLQERMLEADKFSSEIWLDADRLDREKENAQTEIERLKGILISEGQFGESQIKEIEDEISAIEVNIEKKNDQIHQKNIALAGLKSSEYYCSTTIERLERELSEVEGEREELKNNNLNFSTILQNFEEEVEHIQTEISGLSEAILRKEEEKLQLTLGRDKLNEQGRRLHLKREELSEAKSQLEQELIRLQHTIEKMEGSLQSLVEYMAEEYHLTYSEIIKSFHYEEDYSKSELKKRMNEKKTLIKELGNININAIEEYKEVKERYELLQEQNDDIVKAEKTLIEVIEELDIKMKEQFNKSFREINQSFDKVFSVLFGGGSGKLELTDGEDILEAGIKIIAEPPGKKLQNMMQLSGGEKALTAIALLFAIQNLKPSPFCLLDEIEAALDDSNVVRFADYLHKLTKNTQFIVITHRRGTMNASDVLYGITMQEKGVSTMVSVNLIEAELSN